MTIIQALKDTTTRLEQYDTEMAHGISHEKAEAILADSEKMDFIFREAEFYIIRQDICGDHTPLIKPLNKALSIFVRVVQRCIERGFQACDEKTDRISRHLFQRLAEFDFTQRLSDLEKKIEYLEQSTAAPSIANGEDAQLSLENLPTLTWQKIIEFLSDEFLIVLRFSCKKFKNEIPLKRSTLPGIKPIDFSSRVARLGHMNLLQWAKANGCSWNAMTCAVAARGGHLKILQWARANGCPWNALTCAYAALGGHLEILQWARANDCPWNNWTCTYAAEKGHLEILQWAVANGCPWDEWTCAYAARNGHFEILKWARANGCPWEEETCSYAAVNGHLEILKWARANGCEWDVSTCLFAAEHGHLEVLQWARANGCPWDEEDIRRNARAQPAILKWLDSLERTA